MTVEVQIRESVLAQACLEEVQSLVFSMCVPVAAPLLYIDHLDTVPGSLTFADAPGGVDIQLKIVIYVVSDADVRMHVNGDPVGATQAFGAVGVAIRLAIVGANLTIASAKSDPSGLPPPSALRTAVKSAIDNALSSLEGQALFDTAPVVSALSVVAPASPDLSRGQGVIAIRFGSSGPVTSQLGVGQDWGVFLDASEAVGLLTRRLPQSFPGNVRWLPNGSTPAIQADFSVDISPLGIDIGGVVGVVTGHPSFIAPSTLKLSASWGLDLTGILSPFEPMVRKFVRERLRSLVLQSIPGATIEGVQGFAFNIDLPPIPAILGAQPRWGGISSSAAGMTIGGPVIAAAMAGRGLAHMSLLRFGRPTWWGSCRVRAASGSGEPPTHFDESQLTVMGGVRFVDAGALCHLEILPPNQWLAPLMSADDTGVGFDLTVGTAEEITSDVQILIQTARGVRLVDIGKPIIRRGENDELDVQVNWLPNCLHFSGAWLKLAVGEHLLVEDFKPPPLEDPNWMKVLGASRGLSTHLITINGLEPGEMVMLRGHGLELDVTANNHGIAIVPAIVWLAPTMDEVVVQRVSRRAFTGAIRIQTTEFNWVAVVGAADAAVVRDDNGTALIARRVGDAVHVEEFRPDRPQPFVPFRREALTELNPQPLPPNPPPDAERLARSAGLEDMRTVQTLPGVDGGHLALAQFDDGGVAIVTMDGRTPRVAGRWSGSTVGMQIDGRYALAKSGDRVHLFAVNEREEVTFTR